jgi:hypothetical protein
MARDEAFSPGDAVLVNLTDDESSASGWPKSFIGEYVKTAASGRVVLKTVIGTLTVDARRCRVPAPEDVS